MNGRILKKLSKRAAPLLPLLADNREQFRSEKGENETMTMLYDQRGKPDLLAHPAKGTVMVGEMDGGESPEWSEETAWDALLTNVIWAFSDYDPVKDEVFSTRKLDARRPGQIFEAADELIAAREAPDE